jgi:hypothetical protein
MMAKTKWINPLKGIPRDQWPKARAARGEAPLALGKFANDPKAVPLSDVPRETLVGDHTQPIYAENPDAVILPIKVTAPPDAGRKSFVPDSPFRDYGTGAGPAGTSEVKRPPDATFSAPRSDPSASQTESDVPKRIPPNLFAKGVKSLEVFSLDGDPTNPLPGFRLHWFVDENNSGARLKLATMSGWEFVKQDEVMVSDTVTSGNNDLGNHIRKLASKSQAIYQYLMKLPLDIEKHHQAEYANRVIAPIKDSLRGGRISNNPGDMQYAHRDHKIGDAKTYTR